MGICNWSAGVVMWMSKIRSLRYSPKNFKRVLRHILRHSPEDAWTEPGFDKRTVAVRLTTSSVRQTKDQTNLLILQRPSDRHVFKTISCSSKCEIEGVRAFVHDLGRASAV